MFARTWSEELVAEWLSWHGFAVLVSVPAGSGRGGGRNEADVVGFRFEGDKLVIEHWEISSILLKGKDVTGKMKKKFSRDRVKAIEEYIINVLGLSNKQTLSIEYRKRAIIFTSKKALSEAKEILQKEGIKVYSIREFFEKYMKHTVEDQVRVMRTFPDSYWLLNMLYTLRAEKIIDWQPQSQQ